jgi:dihydrofolate reductase
MRRLVLQTGISLDGYVARPGGHGGGSFGVGPEDPELKQWKLAALERTGTHIMGRVTYEEMAAFWPTSTDAYAAPMNEIPKVVFSKTLERADWPETRIASGDLAEEVAALKAQDGGDIVAWGGAAFDQSLSRAGLVDEYRLVVQPVALGSGLPLFADLPDPLRLRLTASTRYPSGRLLNVYELDR